MSDSEFVAVVIAGGQHPLSRPKRLAKRGLTSNGGPVRVVRQCVNNIVAQPRKRLVKNDQPH